MIGTTLGHYRIDAEISTGGMGAVYRATHTDTDLPVAIKVLPPAMASDRRFVQRFKREVRALQQVDHPHVIDIRDVGSEGDIHYFAMEYLEQTLADVLRGGRIELRHALQIASQVARGLEAVHAAGIIHRDVKPSNILFTPDGIAKVSDFGIAKVSDATRMTHTGAILGTPVYMAPEQADGPKVDARADVYSLGVVLYEMVCGRPPFEGRTTLDVLRQHRFSLPESPKNLNPQLPAAISHLILHMIEKSPTKRPPHMSSVATSIGHLLDNLSADPHPLPRHQLSATERADRIERAAARCLAWGKRLLIAVAIVAVIAFAYWVGDYLNRTPADYLRDAQALEAADPRGAIRTYEALIKRFPDAPEATQARARAGALRQKLQTSRGHALAERTRRAMRADMAYRHFRRAREAAEAGKLHEARRIYRLVCDHFADTPWGPRADARLQELGKARNAKPHAAPQPTPSDKPRHTPRAEPRGESKSGPP